MRENGGYKPSGLGGRWIVVWSQLSCPTGRQTKILQLKKSMKFENFTSNAHFACINSDWPTAITYKVMAIVI